MILFPFLLVGGNQDTRREKKLALQSCIFRYWYSTTKTCTTRSRMAWTHFPRPGAWIPNSPRLPSMYPVQKRALPSAGSKWTDLQGLASTFVHDHGGRRRFEPDAGDLSRTQRPLTPHALTCTSVIFQSPVATEHWRHGPVPSRTLHERPTLRQSRDSQVNNLDIMHHGPDIFLGHDLSLFHGLNVQLY